MDSASHSRSICSVWPFGALGLGTLLLAALCAPAVAQQELSPVVAKSPDNVAAGDVAQGAAWDLSATDCTYKVDRRELWVVDSYSGARPFVLKFQADDLARIAPEVTLLRLPPELEGEQVLGIAEVPHGRLQGLNLVLVDTSFGTDDPASPQIGVYGDDGTQVDGAPFLPVVGIDPTARLTSMSVNPELGIEEIAVYDAANHAFYVLDFFFSVVRGPTPCLGFRHFFARSWTLGGDSRGMGMGITYNGPDTVLVTAGFFNLLETRFALEYDAARDGGYTGRTLDLSAATQLGATDLLFTSVASGRVGDEDVLFALNLSDESVYAFTPLYQDQPEPVTLDRADCSYDPATGQYTVSWGLNGSVLADSVAVFENGVQVATLPPDATEFQSELPLVGKVFIEIATEVGGVVSDVRQVCELQNTQTPRLPDVTFDGNGLQDFDYGDIAVTKTPARPEDFRMYLHIGPSFVGVLDHTLSVVPDGSYELTSPRTETAIAAEGIGLTIAPFQGTMRLAALDPNGFANDGFASVAFFPLEGSTRGEAVRVVDTVDLTDVPDSLSLRNWDYVDDGEEGYYVAAGTIVDGGTRRFVLVRLEFSGSLFVGTNLVRIPQRRLSPFVNSPLVGIAVSSLPSGHLLVAAGNPALDSYSEAVLTTPFGRDSDTAVRFVGYAQGLRLPGQFFGLGPDVGPRRLNGVATAYFPPADGGEGIGVTYHTAERPILSTNPAGIILRTGQQLLIHSENEVADPGLVAEQLLETGLLLQSGAVGTTPAVSASFANEVPLIDYYVTLVNLAGFISVPVSLEVLLDGVEVPEASRELVFEPGRNLRLRLPQRPEKSCQVRIVNGLEDATEIRIIVGAIGVLEDAPQPADPMYLRGDCNGDGGLQLADAPFGLAALFQGAAQPPCPDACDVDDDGTFNIGDMISLLMFLFSGGAGPAAPGPEVCGIDPVDDGLPDCVYDACP